MSDNTPQPTPADPIGAMSDPTAPSSAAPDTTQPTEIIGSVSNPTVELALPEPPPVASAHPTPTDDISLSASVAPEAPAPGYATTAPAATVAHTASTANAQYSQQFSPITDPNVQQQAGPRGPSWGTVIFGLICVVVAARVVLGATLPTGFDVPFSVPIVTVGIGALLVVVGGLATRRRS